MKRLGKFTGKIYDDDFDFSKCLECCVCISPEQANDEKFIADRHTKDLLDCLNCMGCTAATMY